MNEQTKRSRELEGAFCLQELRIKLYYHRSHQFAAGPNRLEGSNLEPFHEYMDEYKKQMQRGVINLAYKGLMEYIIDLRNHFKNKYPDYSVSGSLYYGYMDMTYFPLFPKTLKDRKLKAAIVFIHEAFRFEVWLAGVNRQVQAKYWKLFEESGWDKYHIVSPAKGVDAIVEHVLVDNPDFRDLDALTEQIERETVKFIQDVESFLSQH